MSTHLRKSFKVAEKSTYRARMGAVILKGGRVISTGFNELRYSKHNTREWGSVHAEEAAIVKVIRRHGGLAKLAGATMYITRIKKDGTTGLAKPCELCQELIDSVGIKKVFYTD